MKRCDVVCVGNSAVDVPLRPVDPSVFVTDSYPVDRIIPTVGGSGTNVATVLSRLGVGTKLITLLGQDMLGDFLVDHCKRNGVDTGDILRSREVDTPLSVGLVREDGERSFVVSRASSTFRFCADHVNLDALAGARVLVFSSIFIMPCFDAQGLRRLFSAAREAGLTVCADMMRSRTGERLEAVAPALEYVDYFFANREEAAHLTGEEELDGMFRRLTGAGVGRVIIKNGREGCHLHGAGRTTHCPAYRNESPVDTIGAGDNFAAGFVAGLLDGLDDENCAWLANATAAVSVAAPGSTGGVRSREQVEEFMSQHEEELQ